MHPQVNHNHMNKSPMIHRNINLVNPLQRINRFSPITPSDRSRTPTHNT